MFYTKPGGASSKESTCQSRTRKRHSFYPGVGKIPWSRQWPPAPVFLPAESPWTEEPGGLQFMTVQRVTTEHTHYQPIPNLASYLAQSIPSIQICD